VIAVELVAIVDGQELVRGGGCVRIEQDDIRREVPTTPRFGIAGVDEDPMEPRLEPIQVAERRELPPHLDEGYLDRVLCEVGVAQDPVRDEDAAVADLTNQGAERFLVTLLCSVHDRSQHPLPPGCRRPGGAVNQHESEPCRNRSTSVPRTTGERRLPHHKARASRPGLACLVARIGIS
jgi:hypothetical protein